MINRLSLCSKGLYKIVNISFGQEQDRLLEIGFLPSKHLYIIQNNSLGIQVHINRANYLLNEVIASMIYIEPINNSTKNI